jgi:hypothetical protein
VLSIPRSDDDDDEEVQEVFDFPPVSDDFLKPPNDFDSTRYYFGERQKVSVASGML